MKVLLVGDYSSLHVNLQQGLNKLGIETLIAARKDYMRNIDIDINLWPYKREKNRIINKVFKGFYPFLKLNLLKNYDVVQFVGPYLFANKLPTIGLKINSVLYRKIINTNKSSFLISCGDDAVLSQIGIRELRYNFFKPGLKDIPNTLLCSKKALKWNIELVNRVDGVVPTSYEYSVGYNKMQDFNRKTSEIIPMPINTDYYFYKENKIHDGKIRFMHGITRPHFKGTEFIVKALERLKSKYPNDVELFIFDKVPLRQYEEIINKTNVVMDQTNSYGYGMNALIAMASGKVVMSGAEPEIITSLNRDKIPVVNIISDVNQIYTQLVKILENKTNITKHGYESRRFVEELHDAELIAQKYLNFWKLNGTH